MEYVWSLQGTLSQLIFSPKGEVEGLLLKVGGLPVQFVVPPEQRAEAAGLAPGAKLQLEGTVRPPSPKGEPEHDLYDLSAIVRIDGKQPPGANGSAHSFAGVVTRLNYAKHGEANGYILDSGDFVHTKPDGLKRLGLAVGDRLQGRGAGARLASGTGRVFEAETVNGTALS